MDKKLFGARALVYLKYDGEIESLGKLLSRGMEIPEIYFDTGEEPPHEVFGMSEFLGFELWLNKSTSVEGFNFEIEVETFLDVKERFEYEMFDLSAWLAKEISRRCEIETFASQA
jgi:hypothetical protein